MNMNSNFFTQVIFQQQLTKIIVGITSSFLSHKPTISSRNNTNKDYRKKKHTTFQVFPNIYSISDYTFGKRKSIPGDKNKKIHSIITLQPH